MLDGKIINKIVNQIQNLRRLGFNALGTEDLKEITGGLQPQDARALSDRLTASGAVLHGHTWLINGLDVDELAKIPTVKLPIGRPEDTPAGPVKLVTVLAKVPAGTWGKDIEGKIKFIKDPDFHFPNIEADVDPDNVQDEDSDTDEGSYTEEPTKGKLDIDL